MSTKQGTWNLAFPSSANRTAAIIRSEVSRSWLPGRNHCMLRKKSAVLSGGEKEAEGGLPEIHGPGGSQRPAKWARCLHSAGRPLGAPSVPIPGQSVCAPGTPAVRPADSSRRSKPLLSAPASLHGRVSPSLSAGFPCHPPSDHRHTSPQLSLHTCASFCLESPTPLLLCGLNLLEPSSSPASSARSDVASCPPQTPQPLLPRVPGHFLPEFF